MKKSELEEIVSVFTCFIMAIHDAAGIEPEEEFDPEEAAKNCLSAITKKVILEYSNKLLMANNSEKDLSELVSRMKAVESDNATGA